MDKRKNILVCALGLTPQIVTECLYVLSVQQQIIIDEIYILTTSRGKKVLSGKDEAKFTPKVSLISEIKNLCKEYELKLPKFINSPKHVITANEEAIDLPDIRDDKHNILFPNKAAEFLRKLTSEPAYTLYCSISGGRKTMGVHLAAALSIFGREQDKLLHILTEEEFEFKGFYPKSKKEKQALTLAEVPYVRLRSLITPKTNGDKIYNMQFSELVSYAQAQLEILYDPRQMIINPHTKELQFNGVTHKLPPVEFAIYFQFVIARIETGDMLGKDYVLSKEFGKRLVDFYSDYYGYYKLKETTKKQWMVDGIDESNFNVIKSKINTKIIKLIQDEELSNLYTIVTEKEYGNSKYYIKATRSKFQIMIDSIN